MASSDTTGVVVLAALLRQLSDTGGLNVAELAAERGFARATAFAVTRRLREDGFVVADALSGLAPGPEMRRLAWAALGLAELNGPAEAVVRWLVRQVEGEASLSVGKSVLVQLSSVQTKCATPVDPFDLEAEIGVGARRPGLLLKLTLPRRAKAPLTLAELCLHRAALTLEHYVKMSA